MDPAMVMVLRNGIKLIIDVNCNAFQAAKELESVGLEVDTVLCNTKVVMGSCVPVFKSAIESCQCVVKCEEA